MGNVGPPFLGQWQKNYGGLPLCNPNFKLLSCKNRWENTSLKNRWKLPRWAEVDVHIGLDLLQAPHPEKQPTKKLATAT